MSETTVAAAPVAVQEDVFVLARSPQEMGAAQARLVLWADAKLAAMRRDHAELTENYELAKSHKWKSSTLRSHIGKAQRRIEFYEKIKAALEAGYCIIPDFPIDVFAIRTTGRLQQHTARRYSQPQDQTTNAPPLGDGRIVDSQAVVKSEEFKSGTDKQGNAVYDTRNKAIALTEEIDFPFSLAKPEIMTATQEAISLKMFDEIGVSPVRPGRRTWSRPSYNGDPMVVGRTVLREGAHNRKTVSFLIAWFIDTKDLP